MIPIYIVLPLTPPFPRNVELKKLIIPHRRPNL